MVLSKKLIIGRIQEDDEKKSYFRVRPLAIKNENGFEYAGESKDEFPNEGFMRIIPDRNELKNEHGNYRTRMQDLGTYCVIDLRNHAGYGEKIRDNAHYNSGDVNAKIIYSDVIQAMDPGFMAEVVTPDQDSVFPIPGTKYVAVEMQDGFVGIFRWKDNSDMASIAGENLAKKSMADAAQHCFTYTFRDEEVKVLTDLGNWMQLKTEVKPEPKPAEVRPEAPAEVKAEESAKAEAPAAETKPEAAAEAPKPEEVKPEAKEEAEEVKPEVKDEPKENIKEEIKEEPEEEPKAEAQPEVKEEAAKPEAEVREEAAEEEVKEEIKEEAVPAAEEAKPEIKEEPKSEPAAAEPEKKQPQPQPQVKHVPEKKNEGFIDRTTSMRMQSGMNPKHHGVPSDMRDDSGLSKLEPLGAIVRNNAELRTVQSPIDEAVAEVEKVWAMPKARPNVVNALLKLDGMDTALGAMGVKDAAKQRAENQLNTAIDSLEAEKVRLLHEIDELRIGKVNVRAALEKDIKRSISQEISKSEQKLALLTSKQEEYEQSAAAAKNAAQEAQATFDAVLGEGFEERMLRLIAEGRAKDLMRAMAAPAAAVCELPETREVTAGELISELRGAFDNAGITLSNDDAVNLLVCMTVGNLVALTGPSGCGKTNAVGTLASVLGIRDGKLGRFAMIQPTGNARSFVCGIEELTPTGVKVVRLPKVKNVIEAENDSLPSMLLLDNIRQPLEDYMGALLSQLDKDADGVITTAAGELNVSKALRVFVTARDAHACFNPAVLDRAWVIPMTREQPNTDWNRITAPTAFDKAVSLEQLKKLFSAEQGVPAVIADRMSEIREAFGKLGILISRRTLNDVYAYCAMAVNFMKCTPIEVLDRALAQRVMPLIAAENSADTLNRLPRIICDMPRSIKALQK